MKLISTQQTLVTLICKYVMKYEVICIFKYRCQMALWSSHSDSLQRTCYNLKKKLS